MDTITLKGKIIFNPKNETKKHEEQSKWKVIAMVLLSGEICQYYSWFIEKRYSLKLNISHIRGAHVTFINDSILTVKGENDKEKRNNWKKLSEKWDGKFVDITFSPDVRTNGKHWWMNIPEEFRGELQSIRDEVGLSRPHFGMHITVGRVNEKDYDTSSYIHRIIKRYEVNENKSQKLIIN